MEDRRRGGASVANGDFAGREEVRELLVANSITRVLFFDLHMKKRKKEKEEETVAMLQCAARDGVQ